MSIQQWLESFVTAGPAPRKMPSGLSSHPYAPAAVAELSADLRDTARSALPGDSRVRRIFAVPAHEYPGLLRSRYVPEQALIFVDNAVIHVQAAVQAGQPAQARLIRAPAVLYLQVTLILLYGRVEIVYVGDGQPQRAVVEFNTVGWELLQPGLRGLLADIYGLHAPARDIHAAEVSHAEIERMLPFKFVSGVRIYMLAPGEHLLGLDFQPAVWAWRWLLFRRQLTPPVVLALTDRHVTILAEERALGRTPSYGWIFTFFPRHCVQDIRSRPSEAGSSLAVELEAQGTTTTWELELMPEAAASWEAKWRAHSGGRMYERGAAEASESNSR
jgi:hypothetical protein